MDNHEPQRPMQMSKCQPAVRPRPTWLAELKRGPDHRAFPFGSLPNLLMVNDLLVDTEAINPPVFVILK